MSGASNGAREPWRKRDQRTIAIVGLGQIGGSLVLAIRKKKLPYRIIGIDNSRKRLKLLAKKLEKTSTKWIDANQADLIILCLHYRETIRFLKQAPAGLLIVDVCSAKEKIVALAEKSGLRFIGGHPLCGNEHKEEKGWDAEMFPGSTFFFCPARQTLTSDKTMLKGFIRKLGAHPTYIDSKFHDFALSLTSHFPAFLSAIVAKTCRDVPGVFKGPGYKSITRLSKTSPALLETFLESNRTNILKAAKQLQAELDRWVADHGS